MDQAPPVTVVVSRVVHADAVDRFHQWADRVDAAAAAVDGHGDPVRLSGPGGFHHLVYRFASADQLARWEASETYQRLMREGAGFSIHKRQVETGRHARFDIPGEGNAAKWRQALMTWTMVFPLLLGLNGLVSLIPIAIPMPVRLAVSSMIMTGTLTWVILPRVSRWLRPWMLNDGHGRIR